MAKRTEKITQSFSGTRWMKLRDGWEAFQKAKEDGKPIRILHPSGSFKVIHNASALPEGVEARHKA